MHLRSGCNPCPTTPSPPFRAGEKTGDPLEMYLSDVFTSPANLAGLPGISIPALSKRVTDWYPVNCGVLQEEKLLNIAYAFQQGTDFHKNNPNSLKNVP